VCSSASSWGHHSCYRCPKERSPCLLCPLRKEKGDLGQPGPIFRQEKSFHLSTDFSLGLGQMEGGNALGKVTIHSNPQTILPFLKALLLHRSI
uniref:Uncharacterized protein n=1 Tax=Anas platyrhynchos TaxID=8839 RepID=A0A8B9TDI9_ANAPL